MTTFSRTCPGPARAKRAGWIYLRVRRFQRAAVTTCPNGHLALCAAVEPGTWPAYVKLCELWDRLRWATIDLCAMTDRNPLCYVVPSYSGGEDSAYVDGKLRRPQCFGSHREAWAQPTGTRWTVHGRADEPALVLDDGESWVMTAPMVIA